MSISFQSLNEDLEQITISCPSYEYPIMLNIEKMKLEKIKHDIAHLQTLDIAQKGALHAQMLDLIFDDLQQRRNKQENENKSGNGHAASNVSNGIQNGIHKTSTTNKTNAIDRRQNKAPKNFKPLLKIQSINATKETDLRVKILNIGEKIRNTEEQLKALNSKIQEFEALLHPKAKAHTINGTHQAPQNTTSNGGSSTYTTSNGVIAYTNGKACASAVTTAGTSAGTTASNMHTAAIQPPSMNLDLSFAKQMIESNQTPKLSNTNDILSQRDETPRYTQMNGIPNHEDATPRLNAINQSNANNSNPATAINPEFTQSPRIGLINADNSQINVVKNQNNQQKDQDEDNSNNRFAAFTEVIFTRRLAPTTTPVMSRPNSAGGSLMNITKSPRTYHADPLEVLQQIETLKKLPKSLPPQLQTAVATVNDFAVTSISATTSTSVAASTHTTANANATAGTSTIVATITNTCTIAFATPKK